MNPFSKRRRPQEITSSITILSYGVESEVAFSPNRKHIESHHKRIWHYYCNGDVHKARRLAFKTLRKEMDRFAENTKNYDPDSYRGLKLWVDYWVCGISGDKNNGVVKRLRILDGTDTTFAVVLGRLDRERKILKRAGVKVDLDEGWLFFGSGGWDW